MRGLLRHLAVTAGFEPAVACTTHAFQACSFGRSDTSPGNNLNSLSDRADDPDQASRMPMMLPLGGIPLIRYAMRPLLVLALIRFLTS